eukprot:COSAG02_NODE_3699_length_6364_cov_1.588132_2_plen_403_part_00
MLDYLDFTYVPVVSAEPHNGCILTGNFADGSMAGKIALIQRGACFFTTKTINAQNAGAVAVIIYNNGDPLDDSYATDGLLAGPEVGITIPTVWIDTTPGEALNFAVTTSAGIAVSLHCGQFSSCEDTDGYLDEIQDDCESWVGYDCLDDQILGWGLGYTAAGLDEVALNCRLSCGLCTACGDVSPSEATTLTNGMFSTCTAAGEAGLCEPSHALYSTSDVLYSTMVEACPETCGLCGIDSAHPGCVSCAPGQYDHDNSPTTECILCPRDTYSNEVGAVACHQCPPGLFSSAGALTIDDCVVIEPAYLGCYNDGPLAWDMEVESSMRDVDLVTESREACGFICADYMYMDLTWTSQCRWYDPTSPRTPSCLSAHDSRRNERTLISIPLVHAAETSTVPLVSQI